MQPKLIIVSNRLPVSARKTDGKLEFYPSSGGLATGLSSYANNARTTWIGWPGIPSDDLTEVDKLAVVRELKKNNCHPVFLTKKQIDEYYNGYSNSILWPLFHHSDVTVAAKKSEERFWKAYKQVNSAFADAVSKLASAKTTIWVHDYQLLLLPSLLRAKHPNAKLGLFSHIPFPENKAFSTLAHSEALLIGMVGADLLGFHTESYVHNFLETAQQHDIGIIGSHKLILPDRVVRVTDFPMGIDYKKFSQATVRRAVKKEYADFEARYRGKKVILTVDRLDPSKGLVERATAYQTLLRENPHLHRKVVMNMLAVPSRAEIDAYKQLKVDLEAIIAAINTEFGTSRWQPVDYLYDTMPFDRLSALYQRADVAFIAPLRDGMNLVAKEYVASKQEQSGILILSQTAGAAEELKDAIMVSHAEPSSLVRGLSRALTMPTKELQRRTTKMQDVISTATVQVWAGNFMKSLRQKSVVPGQHRLRSLSSGRNRLNIVQAYRAATTRLLLLDYDGVLAPFSQRPEDAAPSLDLKKVLATLGDDPNTTVVITSGRQKRDLADWLGDLPVTLIAEHGTFRRDGGMKNWHTLHKPMLPDWQDAIAPLLEEYAERTPGAFVEQKDTSLVWHYRTAKPYYAQKHLVILKRLLAPLMRPLGLQARQGNMILEVRENGADKGTAALPFLRPEPNFILTIGDDYTDEDMFAVMPESAYTVKVGRGRTHARYRAHGTGEVLQLLKKLK